MCRKLYPWHHRSKDNPLPRLPLGSQKRDNRQVPVVDKRSRTVSHPVTIPYPHPPFSPELNVH